VVEWNAIFSQMAPTEKRTSTQKIADFLAKEAKKIGIAETALCAKAGLSTSYLSKAKKGILKEIPEKNLIELVNVVEITPKDVFDQLELPEPRWMRSLETLQKFRNEEIIRLRFPYIESVLDHLWPLLAREIFRRNNIELEVEPYSLEDFIIRMDDVKIDSADTICVLNSDWMSSDRYGGKIHRVFRRVCKSHLYHGYSLIGRRQWEVHSLETSQNLGTLFALLAELRYHNVFAEEGKPNNGSIAYCDDVSRKFIHTLIEVSKADPKSKDMLSGLNLRDFRPKLDSSTLTFLEPLSWYGESRFDFVVGHALTTAMALADRDYRVFANFRHLERLSSIIEIQGEDGAQKKQELKEQVRSLKKPVVLAMNMPENWREDKDIVERCRRLCKVVRCAVKELFRTLTSGTVREMESILEQRDQTKVSAKFLRTAWEASYEFSTDEDKGESVEKDISTEGNNTQISSNY
jgi:transcriptional regulator with XRE-family HTH domain